tara:strand:+ start:651 stop:1472 length:822 start_codon:yes stop_codon:yes gene_type:complete
MMPELSLLLIPLIIGLVLLVIITTSISKKRKTKAKQILGLDTISNMRLLLAYIQKHRGMSMSFLNGGTNFTADINQIHLKIDEATAQIMALYPAVSDNQRWIGLIDHWGRIKENYPSFEVDNNFEQHKKIIKNLLYLIDDIAQDCELLLIKNKQQKPIHIYWRELLTAAEHIGQARAIGVGVSTMASCSSVARIRLKHSCQKIEDNTQSLWKEIGRDKQQEICISKLIDCITNDLMSDNVTIAPKDFFSIATNAIESLFMQFDLMIRDQSQKQ